MFSNPSGPLGVNNAFVNNGYDAHPKTTTTIIRINPLTDNSQMQYSEGDILLIYNPKTGVKDHNYTALSLWKLNYLLEMALLEKSYPVQDYKTSSTKLAFPTTIDEFNNLIHFLGCYVTATGDPASRLKNCSVAVAGEVRIPNIFPQKEGRRIQTGDIVFLRVSKKENPYDNFIDTEGARVGTKQSERFLQVTGYWEASCREPIGCTSSMKPSEEDVDFMDVATYDQKEYHVDENGLLDISRGPISNKTQKLIIDEYQQGQIIRLGMVIRVDRQPSTKLINEALRTPTGWKELRRGYPVDIKLEQNTSSNLWV
jgi:hypothetical protein